MPSNATSNLCKLSILVISLLIFITGCSLKKQDDKKLRDIDFTIVTQENIPDEVKSIINECDGQYFRKTFSNNENTYIIISYGDQPTTGYSISVRELYEAENAIYVKTTLSGPSKTESVSQVVTCPYVVIKMEYSDKNVVF